ncbi:hypothetical protein ADZ36_02980 [Streptomyces fradiae]|uniref:Uncharacterized protein n=2 Tax=Streptomyces TaxID=1883 RepID=A0A3R7IMM9_9ACTN|nr:hypothetical protein ADZ36_02980 [Streptomyces fradiae]OFA47729.1 hypothetical protein BEN35_20430 [Streptomyces fradiae]PQM23856.1 hypothetical protein Sfr7A_09695 [Streptomyces xinghaiensis]RKM92033.1 hypothetical protein SFRA_026725 [Streptomyces xinghaiensis]RNC73548.1 hypothetical protein DC095_015815 [Streptomyces xinghaiensis]
MQGTSGPRLTRSSSDPPFSAPAFTVTFEIPVLGAPGRRTGRTRIAGTAGGPADRPPGSVHHR